MNGSSVNSASIDALYTPSASRSASWYVAIGPEWQFGHRSTRRQLAEEVGLKFRFLAESKIFKNFLGGRIGVRAAGSDPIRNARFVFEFGTGSW